jgi:DNA primase
MDSQIFIDTKNKLPIEVVIGDSTPLQQAGDDHMIGKCTLCRHEDKDSLIVYLSNKAFYCVHCKRGGDIIHFTASQNGTSVIDAVNYLREKYLL